MLPGGRTGAPFEANSQLRVAGLTEPVCARPCRDWNRITADRVHPPLTPSAGPALQCRAFSRRWMVFVAADAAADADTDVEPGPDAAEEAGTATRIGPSSASEARHASGSARRHVCFIAVSRLGSRVVTVAVERSRRAAVEILVQERARWTIASSAVS